MTIEKLDLEVGSGADGRRIAVERRAGGSPGLFWLNGYRSDMQGAKAKTLDGFGAEHGLAVTRFDYSGHGVSGGDFLEGTISRWLEEALAVFATTAGPQIVVGSSMGGWLALLMNQVLRARGEARIKALVLIAPAVDATEELMLPSLTPDLLAQLAANGVAHRPSQYSETPYPITAKLLEDGKAHLMFGKGIVTGCPVTILQGGQDPDVPQAHALKLVNHLLTDPVTLTLVPDGDHRLSREEDLVRLKDALRRAVAD